MKDLPNMTRWCASAYRELAEINERREKEVARLAELEPFARIAEEAVRAFPGRFDDDYFKKMPVDVDARRGSGMMVGVLLRINDVSDFSDLADIVEWLAERAPFQTMDDFEYILRRTWSFGPGRDIQLMAFLSDDDSNACKVIETGEMKPVLKFVCPGSPELEETPHAR